MNHQIMLQSESGGLGTKGSGEPVCVGPTPHKYRKDSCIAGSTIAALFVEGSHAGWNIHQDETLVIKQFWY